MKLSMSPVIQRTLVIDRGLPKLPKSGDGDA
jgi:hypothetical protein